MGYYLQLDGVDDKIVVPHPANVKYISFKLKRVGDSSGYLFDLRESNGVYCANTATSGYSNFKVDAIDYERANSNISIGLQDGVIHDVLVTLTSDTLVAGEMTIGSRYSDATPEIDLLTLNVYDIKFFNASSTVVQSFDFNTGSGTTLYGTAGNGTITGGTWQDAGVGGGTAFTASLSDSVSTSESFSKRFSAMVVDSVTTGDGSNEGSVKSFSDSIAITEAISKALTKWQTDGIVTGDSESETTSKQLSEAITQTDAITTFGGKSVILTEGITVSDSVAKAVARLRIDGLGLSDQISKQSAVSVALYDVIVSTDNVSTYLPNAPEYRHVMRFPVRLNTRQTVSVTITQRKRFDLDI